MYDAGKDVAQDYKEAVKWYTKAAEQGDATAQFNLGVMYVNGQGVKKDYKEAVKWFTKAAQRGDPEIVNKASRMCKELQQQLDAQSPAAASRPAVAGRAMTMMPRTSGKDIVVDVEEVNGRTVYVVRGSEAQRRATCSKCGGSGYTGERTLTRAEYDAWMSAIIASPTYAGGIGQSPAKPPFKKIGESFNEVVIADKCGRCNGTGLVRSNRMGDD
jgi:hypothetical protein